jgi:N-acetylmuramoyl-L-alanine amidase CwlA
MEIIDKLLQINPYSRSGEKQKSIQYIVIHWVGNANTSATANRNYFNNLAKTHSTSASSHYIIGLNGEIIRCIPDDEVAFHSGSYSMNRKSIGIEDCHPDWNGKFTDDTYNALVELCADLCKKYGISINNVIRHYDVTGKSCPKYYVEHQDEWNKLKQDIYNKINGTPVEVPTEEQGSEEKPMYKFKNGKTVEPIFADCNHTVRIGSLNKWEVCECFGIFNGAPMVRYQVGNTGNYKIGFAVDTRCVK